MEAAAFGADDKEASWRVKLTFTYTPAAGQATQQTAELRIAPWIMSSDLDPTVQVFGCGPAELANYPLGLSKFVADAKVTFSRINPGAKPFLRDPMKCGWIQGPHHQKVVIHKTLDVQSPFNFIANNVDGAGTFEFPPVKLPADPELWTSQDNGGNLLVSPPLPGYPLGRIVLGSDGDTRVCRAQPFYARQRVQAPLVVDPTWLSVGHVDEMLSFVPDATAAAKRDPWPWKMLIVSARLGYVLAYAASANASVDNVNLDQLLATAQQVCDASRQAKEKWAALQDRCEKQFGKLTHVGGDGAGGTQWGPVAGPGAYAADPAPPAGQNGKVVLWAKGGQYQAQSIDSYLKRPWQEKNLFHETAFNIVQPRVEEARQTLLRGLGGHNQPALAEGYVVEIPALLDLADNMVTHTADSVNMLVLRTGANAARCLVPKPFGPVCGGVYLFQSYLQKKLVTDLGLTVTFINEWEDLHSHHGEVHCGTNQVPGLLPVDRAWWRQAPPSP
jgi:hypothetical protein